MLRDRIAIMVRGLRRPTPPPRYAFLLASLVGAAAGATSTLLLVSTAGCNSVLGLDELEIVESNSATGSGTAGGGAAATASSSGSGASSGSGGNSGAGGGPCVPTTCAGKECGLVPDGCGMDLDCGSCNAPETCGGDGMCGCIPTTCAALGANCGTAPDGCGATLDCGMCTAPQVCGGSAPNVCGDNPCVPTTCVALGTDCGIVSDGCASTIDCGTCTAPETCGGTGTANVCGCMGTTCAAQGKDCGSIPDGCGGTLACGSCTLPETCGGGGTPNVCGTPVGYNCAAPAGNVPALKLTSVATNLNGPLLAKSAPGDNDRLFIAEQGGTIRILQNGQLLGTAFLNAGNVTSASGEQGLLGLAFHPDYAQNGRFFIHYSDESGGDTVVAEYARSQSNPNVANPNPVAIVLTQDQPYSNHNGGSIEFGSDGMLYIALGDGGSAGDPDNRAQNLNTLLGKILRIDVSTTPYTPAGNYPGALPEVWDIGMRNPFRMSFDACTGDLYIGDVGQGAREEIDFEPALQGNKNYGWRLREGTACYNPSTNCDPSAVTTLPVLDYGHGLGCAVIGGYVYRGTAIPALRRTYFYGDNCTGRIWRTTVSGGVASAPVDVTSDLNSAGLGISAFGQDAAGEMYVVALGGEVYRIDPE